MATEASGRRTTIPLAVALAVLTVLAAAATLDLGQASDAGPLTAATIGDLHLADEDEGPSQGVRATFAAQNLAPGDRHTGFLRLSTEGAALDDVPEEARDGIDHRRVDLAFREDGSDQRALAGHLAVVELSYGPTDLRELVRSACAGPVTVETLVTCASGPDGPLTGLSPPGEGRDLVLTVQFDPEAGDQVQGQAVGFEVEATLHSPLLDQADSEVGSSDPRDVVPGSPGSGSDHGPASPSSPGGQDHRAPGGQDPGSDRSTAEQPPGLEEGSGELVAIGWATSQPAPSAPMPRTSIARLLVQEEPMLDQGLIPHLFDGFGAQVLPVGAAERGR